jgi:hypothetical protein
VGLALSGSAHRHVLYRHVLHVAGRDLLGIDDASWHAALDLIVLNVLPMMRKVTPIMQKRPLAWARFALLAWCPGELRYGPKLDGGAGEHQNACVLM